MPRVNSRAGGGSAPAFSDILGLTGMTLVEAQAYLASIGQEYSIHSMKSWTRGAYNAPAEALEAIFEVFMSMIAEVAEPEVKELPDTVPETTKSRAAAITGVWQWYVARHPELEWWKS